MGSLIEFLILNFQNVSIFNYIILLLSVLLFISSLQNRKGYNNHSISNNKKRNSNSNSNKNSLEKEQDKGKEKKEKEEKAQENKQEQQEVNYNLFNNPISSDEESSSSPQLNSKSFLSPLNFTTGKKIKPHSKKKQSYYVSTYYSSCQAPDQSAMMDEIEEENNSSPELKKKQLKLPKQQQKQQQQQQTEEDESDDNLNSPPIISTPLNINTPNIDQDRLNLMKPNHSHLINDSTGKLNLFLDPNVNSPTNISIGNQETVSRKLIKRKCILPQVLELRWKVRPKKVLIIKKYNDEVINELTPKLIDWLESIDIQVIKESDDICDNPNLENLSEISDPYSIDFIISLGGDGTILHTSSLFKTYIPPILSFSLGSLGFLTAFDYQRHREYITSVIEGKCFVSYRLRLSCTVISGNTKKNYQVLNEVSIDRGTNPYLSNLECSCDDKLITIVQADGLIIATSTGSTAYSLSAGGSLVHPTIPAVLITPICPHTLSFRPVILPSTSTLSIRVPEISRCTAWASFDGKSRQELKQGDRVIIKTSKWAVPVVCKTNESCEWFEKLADNLNWNVRMIQKSLKSSTSYI